MRQLIEYIAKSLVDDPDAVQVRQIRGDRATILKLRVAEDDKGWVIGKGGRVVNAMRTLLKVAASSRRGSRVILDIV